MKYRYSTFASIEATGIARVQRPPRAIAYQVTTYQGPAATTPSAYAHLIVRGIDQMQSAAIVGGPGTDHWLCEWDYLEHPQLYGTWVPLPENVNALAIVAGADPGCIGAVQRGCVSWMVED